MTNRLHATPTVRFATDAVQSSVMLGDNDNDDIAMGDSDVMLTSVCVNPNLRMDTERVMRTTLARLNAHYDTLLVGSAAASTALAEIEELEECIDLAYNPTLDSSDSDDSDSDSDDDDGDSDNDSGGHATSAITSPLPPLDSRVTMTFNADAQSARIGIHADASFDIPTIKAANGNRDRDVLFRALDGMTTALANNARWKACATRANLSSTLRALADAIDARA